MLSVNDLKQIGIPLSDGTKLFVRKEDLAGIKSSRAENRCSVFIKNVSESFQSDLSAEALSEEIYVSTKK